MTGWAIVFGPCVLCSKPFGYNPTRVPSVKFPQPDGPKEPICQECHKRMQDRQRELGVTVWPDPLPGSYDPLPADELP